MDIFFSNDDNDSFFATDDMRSFFDPLPESPKPKPKRAEERESIVPAKRPCPPQVPQVPSQLQQLAPFPAMEEYVCPTTRAHTIELENVQSSLREAERDKRCSKNIFVRKAFLNKILKESEAKSAEIERLRSEKKSVEHYWHKQAALAQPKIAAITSLIKTQAEIVQGLHTKTLTAQEAAGALQKMITPMLPLDIRGDAIKVLGVLKPQSVKVALDRKADRIVISIQYPKGYMSSKSRLGAVSAAMTASTLSSSSSSSSSWK